MLKYFIKIYCEANIPENKKKYERKQKWVQIQSKKIPLKLKKHTHILKYFPMPRDDS